MERDFWLERWDNQQIGFHQPEGQPLLAAFWASLALPVDAHVLVPLCGKTPDMAWLAAQGHRVTGVELSERAARDFFAEQGRSPRRDSRGDFIRYRDDSIEILVGDLFTLERDSLGVFDAVYDRAALIALPPTLRARYAAHLSNGLRAGTQMLLIALDYDQAEMQGPPFAVSESEIQRLCARDWDVATLFSQNALSIGDHLTAKGLTQATEHVYSLTRR